MGNLTINELSNSLNDYMDEKLNTEEYSLMTENKTIVGAINEIYGKEIIANAIGEPLNSSETFTEMSNDINSLLSTFKTNMMNSGVTVESGDKFKALIDKIKGLTEGEGNKGIQMVSGIIENLPSGSEPFITVDLNFKAEFIIINSYTDYLGFNNPDESGFIVAYEGSAGLIRGANSITFYPKGTASGSAALYDFLTNALFSNCYVNDTGFRLPIYQPYNNSFSKPNNPTDVRYVAIGVGEEDTTLRDSLADILENKGAELSGGETLEELITKVGKLEAKLPPLYLYQEGVINTELIGDLIYSTDSGINYPTYTPGETDFYIGTQQTNGTASANLTAKNAIDTLKYRKICIDCETTCTGNDGPRVKFSFAGSELDITTSQNRQIVSFYFIPSKNAIFRLSAGNSYGWNCKTYTRVYNIWLEDEL